MRRSRLDGGGGVVVGSRRSRSYKSTVVGVGSCYCDFGVLRRILRWWWS